MNGIGNHDCSVWEVRQGCALGDSSTGQWRSASMVLVPAGILFAGAYSHRHQGAAGTDDTAMGVHVQIAAA